jgi:hypothetical protein
MSTLTCVDCEHAPHRKCFVTYYCSANYPYAESDSVAHCIAPHSQAPLVYRKLSRSGTNEDIAPPGTRYCYIPPKTPTNPPHPTRRHSLPPYHEFWRNALSRNACGSSCTPATACLHRGEELCVKCPCIWCIFYGRSSPPNRQDNYSSS